MKNGKDIGTMFYLLLADQFALRARMGNCRWNITGPQGLRRLFASHHLVLGELLDGMAGRARMMENCRTAALAEFLKGTLSKAQPGPHPWASEIAAELLAGHELVIHRLRGNLETICTEKHGGVSARDFLNGMIEKHENMARELRAEVEERSQQGRIHGHANPAGIREKEKCEGKNIRSDSP